MSIRKIHHLLFLPVLLLACAEFGYAQQSGVPTASEAATAQKARSYLFVSPNTRENLTLAEVLRKLNSPEETGLIVDERALVCRLGLKARISKAIGSWTDRHEIRTGPYTCAKRLRGQVGSIMAAEGISILERGHRCFARSLQLSS